jgi:CBS domain containing-hemolysin-like protein
MWDVAALAGAVLLVMLNGFFVAAEFALVKVRPTRMDELAARGGFAARRAQHAIHHLDAYLSATQLGITLASLGLGWIGEPAFAHLIAPLMRIFDLPQGMFHVVEAAVAFTVITFLHIVFGELAPKSLAIQRAQSVALAVAWPMSIFYTVFKLPIVLLNGAAILVLKMFSIAPAHEMEMAHSPEEIGMIVKSSEESGAVGADEAEIVRNAIIIGDRDARDVMVPRVDVAYLSTSWTMEEILRRVHEAGFPFPALRPGRRPRHRHDPHQGPSRPRQPPGRPHRRRQA